MNPFIPTAQGLRLIFRRPAIPFAEITWRWSFAAAAWVLGALFLSEYMDSLQVKTVDRILLGTRQPELVLRAIHRIFQGSGFRFTEAGLLLAMALAGAWGIVASLGRIATVNAVLDEFKLAKAGSKRGPFGSLLALNLLRLAITLAVTVGIAGSLLIANSFWSSTRVSGAVASRLFFLMVFFVWIAWTGLNWLLSTAGIFAVSQRRGALGSLAETVRLCQEQTGLMLTAGALFGLLHLGAFVAASVIGLTLFGALGPVSASAVFPIQIMLVACYCAVADWLYTGRVAAYVLIVRGEEAVAQFESARVPPLSPAGDSARVDAAELILSDVPLPAS